MNTDDLIDRYARRLNWSDMERGDMLVRFVDHAGLVTELHDFLVRTTGIELDHEAGVGFKDKPFAVLAFAAGSGPDAPPLDRVDVESEILAMEAFSILLNREDVERLEVVQFNPSTRSRRTLLAYDRRTSGERWPRG